MSLLSGIKYIPSSNSNKSNKKSKDKKHKKDKEIDKNDNNNEILSFDEIEALANEYNDDNVNSSSDMSQRMTWMNNNKIDQVERKQSNNKYNELINKLKDKSSNNIITHEDSKPFEEVTSNIIGSNQITNQSMASILRDKLKSSRSSLTNDLTINKRIKIETKHLITNYNNRSQKENPSLNDLVIEERQGYDDIDTTFSKNILRLGNKYLGKDIGSKKDGGDEEDQIDMKLYNKSKVITNNNKSELVKVLHQDNKLTNIMNQCLYCINSNRFNQLSSYILSTGLYTIVRIKANGHRLNDFHCEIIPQQHVQSIRQCDENVIIEIDRHKNSLSSLMNELGYTMFYCESAVKYNKQLHTIIDCIPIELSNLSDTILCFKDALMTCSEEWSQHKIINISIDKPLHKSIPINFEYIAIDWIDSSFQGMVYVIDRSNHQINHTFCLDIVAGILDEDPIRIRSKQPIDKSVEDKVISRYKYQWDKYDWTKYFDVI